MMKKEILSFLFILIILLPGPGCNREDKRTLPILGRKTITEKVVNGETVYDTLYHTIQNFTFHDQDSMMITNNSFKNRIYVADFFFTTCPTICPLMKAQLLRVYDAFQDDDEFLILSHTIDPEYDNVQVLNEFASRLDVTSKKWHFVTGPREKIYEIAQSSYMVTAMEDENEPGGYIHSGAFILVDKARHIRGLYDGTNADDVDRMIEDIRILLKEYENPL